MTFAANRSVYIKRILMAVLVVFTAVAQHTDSAVPRLFSVPPMLLIPVVVSIAMFERSMAGMIFGAVAGILWDFAAVRGDGYFSVMLCAIGFFSGAAVTYLMRNNIYSALVLSAASTAVCNVGYWLIFILGKGYEGALSVLFSYYLPSVLYTIVFVFIYYHIVRFTVNLTTPKKNRNNY